MGYVDKRREDRLNTRSFTLRNKQLVKQLDAYCLLTDTKLTKYVEEAIRTKLMYDIDDMQKLNLMKRENKEDNYE